jgi:hypothetical protein
MNDYVPKPIQPQALLDKLLLWLNYRPPDQPDEESSSSSPDEPSTPVSIPS